MSIVILLATVVYVSGTLVTAFYGWTKWSVARSMQRDYCGPDQPTYLSPEFIESQRAEYEREALEGAREFTHSPLWPLLALGALARMISDSKKDPNP